MDFGPDFFSTCAPDVAHQTMVALQELPPGQTALRAALRAYNTGKLWETNRGNRYVLRIEEHL